MNDARTKIIKALAHPSRLYIVDGLSEREHCVNELTSEIGCDASTVSRHLSILKNAEVVLAERRGSSVYYSLRAPCIMGFFKCANDVLKALNREQLGVV